MTFFYFVNCCALSYGPYFLMYKKSVLSEYQPYRVSLVIRAGPTFYIEMHVDCVDISDDNDSPNVSTWNFGAPSLTWLCRARHFPVTGRGHRPLWHLLCNQSNSWQTNYQGMAAPWTETQYFLDFIRFGRMGPLRECAFYLPSLLVWGSAIWIFMGLFQSFRWAEHQPYPTLLHYYSCMALD